ncbi:prepilin-type N-terminal cleavage/methylation domain-containing protein [Fretibacterium sp. OH1220_COT-178]|uniref:prepilin-type N-terminal cleavage/methylation domain-containing protein n=1 Tax=Fretibacterium sp. OH1220_COT-178 TaxID=2491047 RepID=UPI000F5E81AD|nr:prepilin-type N-terminal cleavage/methylation domain-containing protein [Fretibacterium sp. OH1220_COT-178]RRD65482.1 prepilin-type N-terminal cleavage/methylation domain-containing protein [Fretibacterium sp. OH1220_COT-178]
MNMRKGFTLVELLIVIVIIGILAAAMLLSSGSATASAEASNVVSNLRSLKAAALMFYMTSMDDVEAENGKVPAKFDFEKHLAIYTDNPSKYKKTEYALVSDTNKKWYVGYDLSKVPSSTKDEVAAKLIGKRKSLGLMGSAALGSAPKAEYNNENVIWMIAR